MGLQIGSIVPRRELALTDLKDKVIAVDAFNALYQFLASIRQPDGTPLMDSKGRTTSHLSGLFYRNMALLQAGIQIVYVFDGEYHELKGKTHEIREDARDVAKEKYEAAVEEGDIEGMGRYARSLIRLNAEMIAESKELLEAMGIAVVQAPGEGEMQCAELVKSGQAYAVASQDYDAIAVGATRLIQNLTLARKRKTPTGFVYIAPEMIEYERVLNELGIDADQLICLAILVGTDFNPGGVKGIGPKKALPLVQQRKYPVEIFRAVEERLDFNWPEVFEIFKKPNVSKEIFKFPVFDEVKIKQILVERHDFSMERVDSQFAKLRDAKNQQAQSTLF
jgi:flap endonuclease-1